MRSSYAYAVLGMFTAVVSLLVVWQANRPFYESLPQSLEEKVSLPSFPGTLVFTARPAGATTTADVYSYDLTARTLATKIAHANVFAPIISTKGAVATLAQTGGDSYQLVVLENTSTYIEEGTVIETPVGYTARRPQWSPDGRFLAYEAVPDIPEAEIDEYRIMLYDTESFSQREVGKGVSPTFFSDGRVAYMRADGIFVVPSSIESNDIEDNEGIIYMEDSPTPSSHMTIAPNDAHIVVTMPHLGYVALYENTGTEWSMTPVSSGIAFWPVFSPAADAFAFVGWDTNARALSEIQVFSLSEKTIASLLDVSHFDIDMFSMTLWQ